MKEIEMCVKFQENEIAYMSVSGSDLRVPGCTTMVEETLVTEGVF